MKALAAVIVVVSVSPKLAGVLPKNTRGDKRLLRIERLDTRCYRVVWGSLDIEGAANCRHTRSENGGGLERPEVEMNERLLVWGNKKSICCELGPSLWKVDCATGVIWFKSENIRIRPLGHV